MDTIIVSYRDSDVLILKQVAERLNLYPFYQIKSEAEYWHILGENTSAAVLICEAHLNNSN